MAKATGPELRPADIGARARMIRRRRGMSLATAAGLAGISKGYLSQLENGVRRFDKRSLINALAQALGCSVIDLTGEPYGPADPAAAEAMATIPAISEALLDCTLDDVPDVPARPIEQLTRMVSEANAHRDQAAYALAGQNLGSVLTELQVQVATGDSDLHRAALTTLIEAGLVAYEITKNLGHPELGLEAARRGYDAACRLGDPSLLGFARWYRALALMRLGAMRRATNVLAESIHELEPLADPTLPDTTTAEIYGFLHLTSALHAARLGDGDQAHIHLDEADRMAGRTGERNALRQHFGPTNAALWRLSIGVELDEGGRAYERASKTNIDSAALGSRNRCAALHFDLSRALAQEGGARDWDAVRHLDQADQIAPDRIRHDPIARELLAELDNRARIRSWELQSLRHRFGLN